MKSVLRLLILYIGFIPLAVDANEILNFEQAVDQIISRSIDVELHRTSLNQIQWRNTPKRLYFLPTLSLDGKFPLTFASNFFPVQKQVQLASNWNLFRWGSDYEGLQAANAEESSQRYLVSDSLIRAESDAVETLVAVILRGKELQIKSSLTEIRADLYTIAKNRHKRGFVPIEEVEKLEVDLENAKASELNSKMKAREALAKLERLLGHTRIAIEWPWSAKLQEPQRVAIYHEDFDLSKTPAWQASTQRITAERHKEEQATRLLLPSIDAQLSYGHYAGFFGSITGWTGTVSMTFPLFDQLTAYSKVKEQSYTVAEAELKSEQIKRTLNASWQSTRDNLKTSIETTVARNSTLKVSRRLYERNLKRFQAGTITANDLAIDQNRMFEAELFVIQGWSDVHINFARLCHSLGRRIDSCLPQ